jgi:hypothetical protein
MDYTRGISYPDWIEDEGKYYITETQKTIARVHRIPNEYKEMLWDQSHKDALTKDGLKLEISVNDCNPMKKFTMTPPGN